jgi:hypothetical protein
MMTLLKFDVTFPKDSQVFKYKILTKDSSLSPYRVELKKAFSAGIPSADGFPEFCGDFANCVN